MYWTIVPILMIVTEEMMKVACIPCTSNTVLSSHTSKALSVCIAINWANIKVLMIVTEPVNSVAYIPFISADNSVIASFHFTRHCLS